MFSKLHKNIELLETHKEQILHMWLECKIVREKLLSNGFSPNFFQDKFASKVFDFTMDVIKKEQDLGNCPVIGVMLTLFKKKNIPLADVFIICVHLKNTLLLFMYRNSILDEESLLEMAMLMDYNFNGVIKEYTSLYYNDEYKVKNCKQEITSNTTTEVQKSILTSAEDYLQEIELDSEQIAELDELESDTLNAIDEEEHINQHSLLESANLFLQYSKVLNAMYEFKELSYTLTILQELLYATECDAFERETKDMVSIYLKAIISDLRSWRVSVFIARDAQDIHYLDKTLLSSIAQLQMTLMPQEEQSEEEIEFF